MKPYRFSLIFLFALVAAAPVPAADGGAVSVEALLGDVLSRHPELAFYEAELDAAKAGQRSARAWAAPELSLEAGRKRAREIGGTLSGEGTAWLVSLAQTFEWPGRLALRRSLADREIDLAELGLARFRAALAARVRVLAHRLDAAAQKSAAAREVATRYQTLRELFLARDPAGIAPLLETRAIEAQELSLRRRALEAELAWRAALTELNQLRGAPPDAELRLVAGDVRLAPPPDTATLLRAAREGNFELRRKRLELEQQGIAVSLARHERYPAVTVSPFYTREKAGEREATFGLGVSVPLPAVQRARGSAELAEARRRQAEAAVAAAQRELEREVVGAAQALALKSAEIASWAPDAVNTFREAAELADRHYRLGAVPLATYLELQNAYLDAVEALVDTRREALEAGLRLQELTGLDLALTERMP